MQLFKSDFRIVADYFVQIRKNKNYIPSKDKILHVEEVLKMMSALTKDSWFEENYTVEEIAKRKNISKEEVERILKEN